MPKIRFLHRVGDVTDGVAFEAEEESDGTRQLLEFSPFLYMAEIEGQVLVIDELDRSLHTLLSRSLIERFLSSDPTTAGQFIFTTHDTNLLDLELMPQDSIWFVEKSLDGGSTLHSLAEFKPEQLGNRVERGYLRGRFGGTPFLTGRSRPKAEKKSVS